METWKFKIDLATDRDEQTKVRTVTVTVPDNTPLCEISDEAHEKAQEGLDDGWFVIDDDGGEEVI